MKPAPFRLAGMAVAVILAGCNTPQVNQEETDAMMQQSRARLEPAAPARDMNVVREVNKVVLPMVAIKEEVSRSWLSSKRIRLINDKRRPLNLAEVVKMFFDQGINISSQIPLEGYTYAGLGVQDADAETALRSILGAVGLDYELEDVGRTVLIRPMASRSWKINLGDRKTGFNSNTASGELGDSGQGQGNAGGGNGLSGGSQGAMGQQSSSSNSGGQGSQSGVNGSSNSAQGANGNGVSGGGYTSTTDDFWASLKDELTQRLQVLLPGVATNAAEITAGVPALQPGVVVPAPAPLNMQGSAPAMMGKDGQAADFYAKKTIGTFAINPVTGYVTVQAPRWLLNDLDKYMKKIQLENSYRITFIGEMLLVRSTDNKSEGLDISAFGRFAQNRYGLAFSNNALGGVTVNFPEGGSRIPAISAGGAVAGSLIGVTSALDGLQIFNAYLRNFGTVNIVQRPVVVTSNGVPGSFQRTSRKYFVQYSQTAASGGTGAAAVGTQNQLIPFDFGTTLTISSRYDSETDLVRANIILDQVVQSGTQVIPQQVSSGTGVQQVNQEVPLPSTFKYRGEVPLRDGDLIVIGGQSEDETDSSDGGVTGLKNSPVGALFGQKNATKTTGTYYFALRVKLTKTE